jgi:hypothetical protein
MVFSRRKPVPMARESCAHASGERQDASRPALSSHALSRAAGGNEKTAGAKQRQRGGEQAQNSRIIAERLRSPLGHSRRFLRVRQDYPTKLTVKVDLPDCPPWAKNWRLGGGVPAVWSRVRTPMHRRSVVIA